MAVTYTFTNGTVADADHVNQNFTDLLAEFDTGTGHDHDGSDSKTITTLGTVTSGTWNGTAISITYGGTGKNLSTEARGEILYFSATGVLSSLAVGTAGNTLKSGGAGADPSWAALNLAGGANYVTGVLPAANGGLEQHTASDTTYLAWPDYINIDAASYTLATGWRFLRGGTIRVKFTLESTGGDGTSEVYGRVYVNGAASGAPHNKSGTGTEAFTDDIAINAGDTVEIYSYQENTGTGSITAQSVCSTLTYVPISGVDIGFGGAAYSSGGGAKNVTTPAARLSDGTKYIDQVTDKLYIQCEGAMEEIVDYT